MVAGDVLAHGQAFQSRPSVPRPTGPNGLALYLSARNKVNDPDFLRLHMPDGKLNDYSHAPPLGEVRSLTQSGGGQQNRGPLFSAQIGC